MGENSFKAFLLTDKDHIGTKQTRARVFGSTLGKMRLQNKEKQNIDASV